VATAAPGPLRDTPFLSVKAATFARTFEESEALPWDDGDGRILAPAEGAAIFPDVKGVEVLSAPSLVVAKGKSGTIEIIREFIYPTAYDPPSGGGSPPVPKEFATENLGITFALRPDLAPDPKNVRLDADLVVSEFEGFASRATEYGDVQEPVFQRLVFQEKSMEIANGSYLVLGIQDKTQQVEDRIPVLAAIPVIGRFFRQESANRFKTLVAVQVNVANQDG
jgi:general secretion pathway protein D